MDSALHTVVRREAAPGSVVRRDGWPKKGEQMGRLEVWRGVMSGGRQWKGKRD